MRSINLTLFCIVANNENFILGVTITYQNIFPLIFLKNQGTMNWKKLITTHIKRWNFQKNFNIMFAFVLYTFILI